MTVWPSFYPFFLFHLILVTLFGIAVSKASMFVSAYVFLIFLGNTSGSIKQV